MNNIRLGTIRFDRDKPMLVSVGLVTKSEGDENENSLLGLFITPGIVIVDFFFREFVLFEK
jgi:hypothetical protein